MDRLEVREIIDLTTPRVVAATPVGSDEDCPTGAAAAFAVLAAMAACVGVLAGALVF
jgi:hypothetical protein